MRRRVSAGYAQPDSFGTLLSGPPDDCIDEHTTQPYPSVPRIYPHLVQTPHEPHLPLIRRMLQSPPKERRALMKTSPRMLNELQQEWLVRIKASRRSGQTVAEYAKAHNLEPQHLYTWTTRLRQLGVLDTKRHAGRPARRNRVRTKARHSQVGTGGPVRFSPVEVMATPTSSSLGMRIQFQNGIVLELSAGTVPKRETLSLLASLR